AVLKPAQQGTAEDRARAAAEVVRVLVDNGFVHGSDAHAAVDALTTAGLIEQATYAAAAAEAEELLNRPPERARRPSSRASARAPGRSGAARARTRARALRPRPRRPTRGRSRSPRRRGGRRSCGCGGSPRGLDPPRPRAAGWRSGRCRPCARRAAAAR